MPEHKRHDVQAATPQPALPQPTLAQPDDVCEVSCVHPGAVARAKSALPDKRCVSEATNFLKLLGDPTRLKMLSALSATELCVCDLAVVVGISESAVSHQLRLLRTGRLVNFRKEGRVVYYQLADEHVTTLLRNALEHASEVSTLDIAPAAT